MPEQEEMVISCNINCKIRKHFLAVRITKCWHRLPIVLETHPSELVKSQLDMVLDNLHLVFLLEQVVCT